MQKNKNLQQTPSRKELIENYKSTRNYSNEICKNLKTEDHIVQPSKEVSPPKWHLAHTTWLFEELILVPFAKDFKRFNEQYSPLFNSYYKSVGEHWIQGDRGHLSRPSVDEVLQYRSYIDEHLLNFLETSKENREVDFLLEVGLHHEQQHQELLCMDIKFILGANPLLPKYLDNKPPKGRATDQSWFDIKEGIHQIGHNQHGFSYDNEKPYHKTYIQPASVAKRLVTNGEYLEFIQNGGYQKPELWLSLGWDWVNGNKIQAPLYWHNNGNQWVEFTLHGLLPLDPSAPVSHISYFEANAFANWSGNRLPTEQELEIFLKNNSDENQEKNLESLHPTLADKITGQVWCWTQSHYSPYPGFKTFKGMLGEYNGKFMCNQFVLKGGCVATPNKHYRHSYRNFYLPHQRWMFSGARLARDI